MRLVSITINKSYVVILIYINNLISKLNLLIYLNNLE